MTLIIENLSAERNDKALFTQLNAQLKKGDLLQITGANGCGKSTLLRMLAGFIEPLQGRVLWNNQSIQLQRETYQQQLLYVGHQNGIQPYLTVRENLQLICALGAIDPPPDQMRTALQQVGLLKMAETQAHHLSAGQSRRLALARLFLYSRKLWILDEPLTALDDQGQQMMLSALHQQLNQGGMVILATHQVLTLPLPLQVVNLHFSAAGMERSR